MRLSLRILLLLVSGIASLVFYTWLSIHVFHATDPGAVAWVLLISVLLHEFGHAAVLQQLGFKPHVTVLGLIGGAGPTTRIKEYKNIDWNAASMLYLAGVMMNAVLGIVALLAGFLNVLPMDVARFTAGLNGSLILWNLIPFWILDGGRFAKVLFDSTPEHLDLSIVRRIISIAYPALFITFFLVAGDRVLMPAALIIFNTVRASFSDDPHGSEDPRAMTMEQVRRWSVIYGLLVLVGALLLGLNPPSIMIPVRH